MRWTIAIGLLVILFIVVTAHSRVVWKPAPAMSFDSQLENPPNAQAIPDVQVVELDIDVDDAILKSVKARGIRTICYFNAGSWESYRKDADRFTKEVLGANYSGYPDERWLDIRRIDALAPVMSARLERCAGRGFDAVEPDNINGYRNKSGFPLSADDELAYDRWLLREAHKRGLAIALKNTPELAAQLAPDGFDLAIFESCFKYRFCEQGAAPFTAAGKPVFDLEYRDEGMRPARFCPQAKKLGITALLKRSSSKLDSFREACP
ncbi:MAG: endo alpha-1,4 polygalactosaminidase [Alphaproteobacteria bacterium]